MQLFNSWLLFCLAVVLASKGNDYGIHHLDYHIDNLQEKLTINRKEYRKHVKSNLIVPFNSTRIPGSTEAIKIQDFIIHNFNQSMWNVEIDNFTEKDYNFTNLVFTFEPDEDFADDDYIVLAAHYDTMILPEGFVGAMDSAASCAILLYIGQFLEYVHGTDDQLFDPILKNASKGIKLIFFDGEEALVEWSDDDSIYGSKHLAAKWEKSGQLKDIHLLALMDLIGGRDRLPIPSYFKNSHEYYKMLSDIEHSYLQLIKDETQDVKPLRNLGYAKRKSLNINDDRFLIHDKNFMGDDHVPFYEKNVPILHLIPSSFPSTWHTINDDFKHLDQQTIYKWAVMMSEFIIRSVESDTQ